MVMPDYETFKWVVGILVAGPLVWLARAFFKLEERIRKLETNSVSKEDLRDAVSDNHDLALYNRNQLDKIRDHLMKD